MSYIIICYSEQEIKKKYEDVPLSKLSLFEFFNAAIRFPGKTDNVIKIEDDNYRAIIRILDMIFHDIYNEDINIPYYYLLLAADRLILKVPLLCFLRETIKYDIMTSMSIIKQSDELNTLLYLIYLREPTNIDLDPIHNHILEELNDCGFEINDVNHLEKITKNYTELSISEIKKFLHKKYRWHFIEKSPKDNIIVVEKAAIYLINLLFEEQRYDILDLLYCRNQHIRVYINLYFNKFVKYNKQNYLLGDLGNYTYLQSGFFMYSIKNIDSETDRECIYDKLIKIKLLDFHFMKKIISIENVEFLNKFVSKNYDYFVLNKIANNETINFLLQIELDLFLKLRIMYDILHKPNSEDLVIEKINLSRIPTIQELKENNLLCAEIVEMLLLFFIQKKNIIRGKITSSTK